MPSGSSEARRTAACCEQWRLHGLDFHPERCVGVPVLCRCKAKKRIRNTLGFLFANASHYEFSNLLSERAREDHTGHE